MTKPKDDTAVVVSMTMSRELYDRIESIMREDGIKRSALIRRAIGLYIAARQSTNNGQIVGSADPLTKKVHTVFVNIKDPPIK